LKRCLNLLENEQSMKILTNSLQGTQTLALLSNFVHLFHLLEINESIELGFPLFTVMNNCFMFWENIIKRLHHYFFCSLL